MITSTLFFFFLFYYENNTYDVECWKNDSLVRNFKNKKNIFFPVK